MASQSKKCAHEACTCVLHRRQEVLLGLLRGFQEGHVLDVPLPAPGMRRSEQALDGKGDLGGHLKTDHKGRKGFFGQGNRLGLASHDGHLGIEHFPDLVETCEKAGAVGSLKYVIVTLWAVEDKLAFNL
jgi:hypothetical protein